MAELKLAREIADEFELSDIHTTAIQRNRLAALISERIEPLLGRWIPVSEGSPASRVWVIGCVEHGGKRHVAPVYGVRLGNDGGRFRWESEFEVIAWRELPPPPDDTELSKVRG